MDEWKRAEETLADAWDATQALFHRADAFPQRHSSEVLHRSHDDDQPGAERFARERHRVRCGAASAWASRLSADFKARLDLFYIPCLPFAVRPKSLSAAGVMAVSEVLTTSVSATGRFNKTFTIPPSGGPVIPIQVFPDHHRRRAGGRAGCECLHRRQHRGHAEGAAQGQFQVTNADRTRFDFSCNGSGCRPTRRGNPRLTP